MGYFDYFCNVSHHPSSHKPFLPMKTPGNNIKDSLYPRRQNFGDTLRGNEEVYFSEKLIVMHTNAQMLRQTIGDGTPHRLHNVRVGLYTQGTMDSQINLEERHLGKGMLEFYGVGTLFQLGDVSPDFRAFEVIFDSSYLGDLLGGDLNPLFWLNATSLCVPLDDEEQEHHRQMMHLLLHLSRNDGEQSPVARAMAITLLRYTLLLFQRHSSHDNRPVSRQESIFHEFARLVTLSHGRQRRHSYYADQLHVSEHYLSLAVRHSSGITAKEWIDRVVVTEIKLQLVHSDHTITQIADSLDFPSDSFLCKFFRRHTGMSPLEFRKAYKG